MGTALLQYVSNNVRRGHGILIPDSEDVDPHMNPHKRWYGIITHTTMGDRTDTLRGKSIQDLYSQLTDRMIEERKAEYAHPPAMDVAFDRDVHRGLKRLSGKLTPLFKIGNWAKEK